MIKVNLFKLENAGPKQAEFVTRAASLLEHALNHPDFATRVLNAFYRESRWRSTDGRIVKVPPPDVLARIRSGRERATPADGEVDLHVRLIAIDKGRTIGRTRLGHLPISTGYWYVDKLRTRDDAASLAGHLIHEWCHVSGFFHHPDNSARKDVPYNVGEIVRSILHNRFGQALGEPAPPNEDCGCVDDGATADDGTAGADPDQMH